MEIDFPRHPVITRPETISFKMQRASMNVDKDNRTVHNVTMAQVQEARGHGFGIEQQFLNDLNQYVADHMDGRVQSNMGHRLNALFFQFGAFSNMRIEGKQWVGDLKVYEAADKSPVMKEAAEWFFSLAKEDAKAVMCSINFIPLHFYQYDDKKQKVIINYTWWGGVEKVFHDRPAYVALKELLSCDIVDEGALTSTLFSANGTAGIQLLEMTKAPGFIDWFKDNHQHFNVLTDFYAEQHRFSIKKLFGNIFSSSIQQSTSSMETPPANTTTPPANPPATPPAVPEATGLEAISNQLTQMQTQLTQMATENKQLRTELDALKESPAAPPTVVKPGDPPRIGNDKGRSWEKSSINQQAQQYAARTKKTEAA